MVTADPPPTDSGKLGLTIRGAEKVALFGSESTEPQAGAGG